MTREAFDNFVAEVRARGFTRVRTYGGAIPLESWRPYGLFGGKNDPAGTRENTLRFDWIDESRARDGDGAKFPFVNGVWEFLP